ncbi:hypothetical protein J4422_03005 [Candidatus Pacearchaeota archaeon]|nr:hypothetical protein [Candidatus Pacearchaeota archaeon]
MERREFFRSSAFWMVSLAGLDKVVREINPIEEKDPISEIKTEIDELMKKTGTTLQYRYGKNEDGTYAYNLVLSPGAIRNDTIIPLNELREIKSQLEVYAHPDFYIPGHGRTMIFPWQTRNLENTN